MPDRINLPWGYIEYSNNEISIVSTVDDPSGVRLAAAAGGSLGKISFNRLRSDGVQEEVALLQGKIDERYRSPEQLVGELRLDLRKPSGGDEGGMAPIFIARHDGIQFFVPTTASAPEFLRSNNNRFRLHMQGDGNLVIYDDAAGSVVWASNTVTS